QDIPLIALNKYLQIKGYTFEVLENINLYPCPNSYGYWDAFMVLLIKYLCDPMSDEVELMCEFDKKVFLIKNEDVPSCMPWNYTPLTRREKDTSFPEISLTKSISEDITNMEMKSEQTIYKDNKSENFALGQNFLNKQRTLQKMDREAKYIKAFITEKSIEIAEKSSTWKKPKSEQKSQPKEFSLKSENSLSSLEEKKEEDKNNKVIEEAKKKIFVYNLPKPTELFLLKNLNV
ncbi:unnamed protein product, partial [Meganyctiphanes norvegica]